MSKSARKKLNQREQSLLNKLKNRLSQPDNDIPISIDASDLLALVAKGAVKSNISQGWQMARINAVKNN